jgi:hypothetical protein
MKRLLLFVFFAPALWAQSVFVDATEARKGLTPQKGEDKRVSCDRTFASNR